MKRHCKYTGFINHPKWDPLVKQITENCNYAMANIKEFNMTPISLGKEYFRMIIHIKVKEHIKYPT